MREGGERGGGMLKLNEVYRTYLGKQVYHRKRNLKGSRMVLISAP